jgi:hypothetical protein
MIKVRIREQYKDKKIYVAGTQYDFSNKTDEQLSLIWEQNPTSRSFLEEVVELGSEVTLNTTEFEEALAKAGIVTSGVTAKRLAAIEKKRKSN